MISVEWIMVCSNLMVVSWLPLIDARGRDCTDVIMPPAVLMEDPVKPIEVIRRKEGGARSRCGWEGGAISRAISDIRCGPVPARPPARKIPPGPFPATQPLHKPGFGGRGHFFCFSPGFQILALCTPPFLKLFPKSFTLNLGQNGTFPSPSLSPNACAFFFCKVLPFAFIQVWKCRLPLCRCPPPPPAGTIMQHWMELWKERGRPNRGAELLLFQEATLQFLQQHRQG